MKTESWGAAFTAVCVLGSMFLAGCNDASKPSAPAAGAPQKSTAKTIVEGVTGKAAVDQGLSAKNQLNAVDKQRRKDMEALDQ